MEPPAAVADYRDGKPIIYAATQNPQAVQDTVAKALGIDAKDVTCHVTLLGGGFGRKSKPDYVAEAALLSKHAGKPVKIVWSREDDIHFDYFHSPAGMYLKAAVDEKGKPTRVVAAKRVSADRLAERSERGIWRRAARNGLDRYTVSDSEPAGRKRARAERIPDRMDAIGRQHLSRFRCPVVYGRVGRIRESRSCRISAGIDRRPSRYRSRQGRLEAAVPWNPKFPFDTGRLRNVINLVAEQSGWAKNKPAPGRALGIAAHRSFLSYIAAVVEVEVDSAGNVKIPNVFMAVDAGRVINPDRVKAQFEGAAVFGASLALMGEITAAEGRIQQSNFNGYPVAESIRRR